MTRIIDDRYAGDLETRHQERGFTQQLVRAESDRVNYQPALGPLDLINLIGLLIDRHVFVDDSNTAGPRHRNRHVSFGHGIHRGREQRQVQADSCREPASQAHISRMHLGMSGNQQDIVERQTVVGADLTHCSPRVECNCPPDTNECRAGIS